MAGMMVKAIKSSIFNHVLDLALTIPFPTTGDYYSGGMLGPGLMQYHYGAIMLALLPQFAHGIRNAIIQTP